MQMDVGMDTGAMLRKVSCSLSASETAQSLHDKLAQISAQPLLQTLDELANQTIQPEIQNNELATYAHKINKEDACINWQHSAIEIDRLIRAFNPWPIAYTTFEHEILRIHQAQIVALQAQQAPGTVVHLDKKGMLVATGDQGLLIEKIQFPGGKVISIADWLNSSKSQARVGYVF
ncbi:methionyl-tRNA formyltransferase [Legionella cherrii]|nr:methionyl-tRNA formyltransferase [Legionella cherrii]